ncbi:T9SS type A sorting domain-containing protein [Bizionia saleffrena]|uniref:T9SS type A sorting domain-containing protein n=1 Tax=Bizionia saleffrena TaxID=291189 RepID=A0A8H2QK34_9FLAO|nr:fibronectin type III domain-containing protein [Bizionia saleffrena]TYB77369.1 T9SS type A sorting domain-containing protein [Bizionia saleffrena]
MRKITFLMCFVLFSALSASAQFTFPTIVGPTNAGNSGTTLNINDSGNSQSVTTGFYSSFTMSADWVGGTGNPWSNEAGLQFITTAGSVVVNPPTTGGGMGGPTSLTFSADLAGIYDPSVDGTIDILLSQSFNNSDADFSNIVITLNAAPTCPDPTALTALNFTTTSADLDWTPGSSEAAWNVEYGTIGFTQGTGDLVSQTSVKPYNISGLTSGTSYEFYVQAYCGTGDESSWVGPYSFSTLCESVSTFPMLESFETITSGQPNCWEIQGTTTNASYDWNSYFEGYAGRGMRFDSYLNPNGNTSELISPTYDLSGLPTAQLSFWYKNPTGGNFEILISTDAGASYTSLETGLIGQTDWTLKMYNISTSISADTRVKFVGTSNYANGDARIYLDEVAIKEVPSCPDPQNLIVSNIGVSTADFNWIAGDTETQWEYALLVATEPAPTTGTTIAANVYLASGLTTATDYVFYVRANCASGDSSPFISIPFSTVSYGETCEAAIDVTLLPYNTSDDTVNYGDNYSGSPGTSCGTTGTYLDGDDVVYAYTAIADGVINIAMSGLNVGYSGVFVYTDCADIGTACVGGATNTSTTDYDFDLSVTTGTTYYILISTWPSPQSVAYTLDITEVLCADPTGLGIANVSDVSTDFTWTNGSTETEWNIEYGIVGFTQGTDGTLISGATTNPYAITGLTASTSYDFYVQAVCVSGDLSAWVGPYNFTTSCDVTPSNVPFAQDFQGTVCGTIINEGTGNAWSVSSNAFSGFTASHLRYSYNGSNAANTWYFTQGITLDAGEEYFISYDYGSANFLEKLKVAYGTDNTAAAMTSVLADYPAVINNSPQNAVVTFTASAAGVYYFGFQAYSESNQNQLMVDNIIIDKTLSTSQFVSDNLFSYYPNPVNDKLTLKGQKEIATVSVFNMLGQEVITVAPNAMQSEVDMSTLQAGAYFVKVIIENTTKTIKIIKE